MDARVEIASSSLGGQGVRSFPTNWVSLAVAREGVAWRYRDGPVVAIPDDGVAHRLVLVVQNVGCVPAHPRLHDGSCRALDAALIRNLALALVSSAEIGAASREL